MCQSQLSGGQYWTPITPIRGSNLHAETHTPLRESLNRLVAEGFLVVKPNLGFFRRSLDPEEVYHLYDLRCSLEIQSSKLAAERATDEALESLIQMVSADEEPDNELELLRQDEAFHIKIAELTGNPELVNMLRGESNSLCALDR